MFAERRGDGSFLRRISRLLFLTICVSMSISIYFHSLSNPDEIESVHNLPIARISPGGWAWSIQNNSSWFANNGGSFGCEHALHKPETLWIAMPTWNNIVDLHHALGSVIAQETSGFDTVHVVVFEDNSLNMLSVQQKNNYREVMDVTFLRSPMEEGPTTKPNQGAAYGKWALFQWIRRRALPHEYVFVLDGDDTLSTTDALQYLSRTLFREQPWFAWGRINGKYSEQCGPLVLSHNSVRKSNWSFCHPRIFLSHLLDYLKAEDFQRNNGEWLQKATDRPFIFKFIEMAGPERILFLHERPIYNYTMTSLNGLHIYSKEVIHGDKELINNRPPVSKLPESIFVITCVYDSRNDPYLFLKRLKESKLDPHTVLHIHICNNKHSMQAELEDIASRLNNEQESHHIKIHDMSETKNGFSRFILARKIMNVEFVSYVVMINDDQYVLKNTIASIYRRREPRMYKTLHGKSWDHSVDRSKLRFFKRNTLSDPDPTRQMRSHLTNSNSWQYGEAGMSIIDASIFKSHELFQLGTMVYYLDDMWLSYLVTLSGWPIQRLFDQPVNTTQHLWTSNQTTQHVSIKEEFFKRLECFSCPKEHLKI